MISLCTIADLGFINKVAKESYYLLADDGCVSRDKYTARDALQNQYAVYLKATDNGEDVGYFLFHAQNSVTYESHVCFLPNKRNKTVRSGREAIQWMFANTDCRKLIASVPVDNELTYRYSKMVGFREEGLRRKSFLRDGVLHDQYMMGIEKEVN